MTPAALTASAPPALCAAGTPAPAGLPGGGGGGGRQTGWACTGRGEKETRRRGQKEECDEWHGHLWEPELTTFPTVGTRTPSSPARGTASFPNHLPSRVGDLNSQSPHRRRCNERLWHLETVIERRTQSCFPSFWICVLIVAGSRETRLVLTSVSEGWKDSKTFCFHSQLHYVKYTKQEKQIKLKKPSFLPTLSRG